MREITIHHAPASAPDDRSAPRAIWNGLRRRCPSCGTGRLFDGLLTVRDTCGDCRTELHHHRADDAPAYFTMLIVGHIVVAMVLSVEVAYAPPYWLHMLIWLPLTCVLTLVLLPRVKGALIALQWAFRMHGFDPDADDEMEVAAREAVEADAARQ